MQLDKQTHEAIENSASYLCSVLNESIGVVMKEPLTPEKLVYMLLLSDDVPDGKEEETLGTLRGIKQRLFHLQRAIHGQPGRMWLKYWTKGRGGLEPVIMEEAVS